MLAAIDAGGWSEEEVAAHVDRLAAAADRAGLVELLREEHPVHVGRGGAAVVRIRGWVLLSLARLGVTDRELVFVLEELETGVDPYLVAAAARGLRSYPEPSAGFAPYLARAVANLRYRDEPVCFDGYGEYALPGNGTSPLRELLATLVWLGPLGRAAAREVEALRETHGAFGRLAPEIDAALAAIRADRQRDLDIEPRASSSEDCCAIPENLGMSWWRRGARRRQAEIGATPFEDQDGAATTFDDLFRGHPSVVVFFYTRCDNPFKCSLTVSKLARVQQRLAVRGLDGRVHTAAITYDPGFDLPIRLRNYGRDRGLRMDPGHRVLRATEGLGALQRHFGLGLNFVESLVNRHRVEAFVLDGEGRVAASFERLHWDEEQVVERAVEVLAESERTGERDAPPATAAAAVAEHSVGPAPARRRLHRVSPPLAGLASLGVAFFPKCPICWAAYLSAFGVAGLNRVPFSPWLQAVLVAALVANLGSLWLRGRATARMTPFWLAGAGAGLVAAVKVGLAVPAVAAAGVALTLAGSVLSVVLGIRRRRHAGSPGRGWRRAAPLLAGP